MIYLKEHQIKYIGLGLLVVFILVFTYIIVSIAFPDNNLDLYGNRLQEVTDYPLDVAKINITKDEIVSTQKVNKVSYRLQGRIVNFIINVDDEVLMEDAKEIGSIALKALTDEEKTYYDIQVFIVNKNYNLIGYKHHTSTELIWSNNSMQVIE